MYGRFYYLVRKKWPEMYSIYPMAFTGGTRSLANFFAEAIYGRSFKHERPSGPSASERCRSHAHRARVAGGHPPSNDGSSASVKPRPCIVFGNTWYPPHSGFGGVAMYNWYLSRALVKLGHRATVIASRFNLDVPEMETRDGVVIHRLLVKDSRWSRTLPGVRRYSRSVLQLLYSRRLARAVRSLRMDRTVPGIDLVEFAEVGAEGFCYLRARARFPVVVRCHTPTAVLRRHYLPAEMPYGTKWTEAAERACISKADGLTAPSHDMARVVSELCNVPRSGSRWFPTRSTSTLSRA
jgi:hypothetical protein